MGVTERREMGGVVMKGSEGEVRGVRA
ncbi:hypothetical protein E2C01_085064 [Portunus trituberculatus]|uniref:Uncharacterized protein n=1 Tax=Portunus trituberculatus TaxID=210409 RepID=A0A5B7J9G2_PORTR|nr:hypothetical protein [Portunus trituberculatus]